MHIQFVIADSDFTGADKITFHNHISRPAMQLLNEHHIPIDLIIGGQS